MIGSMLETRFDLSVVIPAKNEALCVGQTLDDIHRAFNHRWVLLETIVVDDHCTDLTAAIAHEHGARVVVNDHHPGYGHAVKAGLREARGTYVVVMVADGSDSADDLLEMYERAKRFKCDAVFGSRFVPGATTVGYPRVKRVANRLGNKLITRVVGSSYGDWTNPFKIYRRSIVEKILDDCQAGDFSLGMELAVRAYRHGLTVTKVVPTHWKDRTAGTSKFKVKHALMFLGTLYRLSMTRETRDDILSCIALLVMCIGILGFVYLR